jgi:hypothetical protein
MTKFSLNEDQQQSKKWYQEFWAWFILSPLIVVVIVSSITVTIAVRNADDRVIDNYYKEGRMINMRMDEDLLAQTLKIRAEVNFDPLVNEVSVILSKNDEDYPDNLALELSHPVEAAMDQIIILRQIKDGHYGGEFKTAPLKNRWYVRLRSVDASSVDSSASQNITEEIQLQNSRWRLRGEIDFTISSSIVLNSSG